MSGPEYVENLAWTYSWFGEHDAASDQLDYVLSIPSETNVGYLRVSPWWDHVRDHPRFLALLDKYDTEK